MDDSAHRPPVSKITMPVVVLQVLLSLAPPCMQLVRECRAWAFGGYVSSGPRITAFQSAEMKRNFERVTAHDAHAVGCSVNGEAQFAFEAEYSLGSSILRLPPGTWSYEKLLERTREVRFVESDGWSRFLGTGLLEVVELKRREPHVDGIIVDCSFLRRFPFDSLHWWPPKEMSTPPRLFIHSSPETDVLLRIVICDPTAGDAWLISLQHD